MLQSRHCVDGPGALSDWKFTERIHALLQRHDVSAAELDRTLRAAALLRPSECLRILVDYAVAIRGRITRIALERIVDSALEVTALDVGSDQLMLEQLAARYERDLTPRVLELLLARFERAVPAVLACAIEYALEESPHDATVLRTAVKLARRSGDAVRADRLSTALGLADNSPAAVASIFRNRVTVERDAADVRIAMLSTFTVDPLIPFVDLECRALGLRPHIYLAPFNSWTQEVLGDASGLRRSCPDITFLAVSIDDLIPQLAEPLDTEQLASAGRSALLRVTAAVEHYVSWAGGRPLVVHSWQSAFEAGPLGILDGRRGRSRREWLAELNAQLSAALREFPSVYVFDVGDALAQSGASLADNPKLRHLAALRLPPLALGAVAKGYARYIAPLKGCTKKCVVLDLDNTLWGGVIGEDGKDGIRLGHTSPGSEFVEFQHFLAALGGRGILLALNSKNNADDALDAIKNHDAMVLRETDFSAIRINWKPKPENMASIAAELNIGLDSLVFIDDNPDERERMRQALPQVHTVDLPKDPALYRQVLEALPQLQVLALTDEDQRRAAQYQTVRLRNEVLHKAASVEDYLQSLQIELHVMRAGKPTLPRVTQLFARTNQFNATTRRYTADDVERFAGDPKWRLYVIASKDRFGDHGLVAVGLVEPSELVWNIDSFLMSCRVIGYGIETALLSLISDEALASGATGLRAQFVPTPKNAPAKELYSAHGFIAGATVSGVEYWERSLVGGPIVCPSWLRRATA